MFKGRAKQKGLAPIIIIVLIALTAIGVYFLGTKNILELPTFPLSPTLSPSPTSTPDPTANWKIYTSSEFGFTFKYPQDWDVKKETPEIVKYREFGSPDFESGKMFGGCDLYIQNTRQPSTVIALDIIEPEVDGVFCWSAGHFYDYSKRTISTLEKPATIGVMKWKVVDKYAKTPGGQLVTPEWKGDMFQIFSEFAKNRHDFTLALVYNTKQDTQAEKTFDQILSTFKFTN